MNVTHQTQLVDRPLMVMDRGAGSWLYDEAGNAYLDFVQGWAVNALGHAPPEVQRALATQGARLLTPSPAYHNRPSRLLCDELAEATGMDRVILCNSGAEANDTALKLARKWGKVRKRGAFKVITTHDAFHGRTLATMAASGKPGWDQIAPPALGGFVKVPYDDLDALDAAIDEETCAVMLEPVQGEAGVIVPRPGYLRSVRELTRERGVLFVLDEIQTGCSRTGPFLRCQTEGVLPDLLTLGKGLGGGVPVAALLALEHCACFERGDHGSTFAGNPLVSECARAVLAVVSEPAFSARVAELGVLLEHSLRALMKDEPTLALTELRRAGLLLALQFEQPVAASLRDACLERGLLVNAARPGVLRLMPSLRVSEEEIALAAQRLGAAMRAVASANRP